MQEALHQLLFHLIHNHEILNIVIVTTIATKYVRQALEAFDR